MGEGRARVIPRDEAGNYFGMGERERELPVFLGRSLQQVSCVVTKESFFFLR